MNKQIENLITRYPVLNEVANEVQTAYDILEGCCASGRTIYACGNGGSAADCDHIVGELMKSFRCSRPLNDEERMRLAAQGELGQDLAQHLQKGLRAASLPSATALTTAIANDMGAQFVFAQQIFSCGIPGDVLLCLSTSGNSENVLYAAAAARAARVQVVSLSGKDGGQLKELSDVCVICPVAETEKIQELHLPIYHALCAALEEHFWGTEE